MHLARLRIVGLFNQFDHDIIFPSPDDDPDPRPSIVILHGPNGIGKTTMLRMLAGLMRLDFNPFRRVPFSFCELYFSTGDCIKVQSIKGDVVPPPLEVNYGSSTVVLSGEQSGPLRIEDAADVERFRTDFFAATEALTFDFIDIGRFAHLPNPEERVVLDTATLADSRNVNSRILQQYSRSLVAMHSSQPYNPKAREQKPQIDLAGRVQRFIGEAQLSSETYFTIRGPSLFNRILQQITDRTQKPYDPEDLLTRLRRIRHKDEEMKGFGLESDQWDFESLAGFLQSTKDANGHESAISALGAYTEMLESRLRERELVAERLRTFEDLMASFFVAKRIIVNSKTGLRIITDARESLTELHLSSGEYHLLYLMVAALTTRRRGTILAIDEPEMSMHISWQRRLVKALVECASGAEPQFLFATHSPDIAAEYPESMVELSPTRSK